LTIEAAEDDADPDAEEDSDACASRADISRSMAVEELNPDDATGALVVVGRRDGT
jgi:hypothetical protein